VRARPVRAVVDSNLLIRGLLRRRQGSAAVHEVLALVADPEQCMRQGGDGGSGRMRIRSPVTTAR